MPAMKHLHTYQKLKSRPETFRCLHPDCTHTQKYELLIGKRAACVCGEAYFLDERILRLKTPHCEKCTRKRSKNNVEDINYLELFPELLKPKHIIDVESVEDTQLELKGIMPDKFEGDLGGEL